MATSSPAGAARISMADGISMWRLYGWTPAGWRLFSVCSSQAAAKDCKERCRHEWPEIRIRRPLLVGGLPADYPEEYEA